MSEMTEERLAELREATINGKPMTRARWRKLFRKFATGGGSEVEALELAGEVERQFYENRALRAELAAKEADNEDLRAENERLTRRAVKEKYL